MPALAVVAGMTALRLWFASAMELRTDEAYYWTWSKESVLSYLDHPPMIAWFIRAGTAVFGDTTLGVRVGGIIAMAVSELVLGDIVRRITRDMRLAALAVLMMEAALYYGLLMAKAAPDVALIPFAMAMSWSLVRLSQSDDPRWWLLAGLFGGCALLSKLTAIMLLPAVAAFVLVPDWRSRWLRSPWPYLAALIAIIVFTPVLIWNAQNDWASFRFQFVRASADRDLSLRTLGDFLGLQFGQVGPVLLPVVLSAIGVTAWRGYSSREPVAILLATSVAVPFLYLLWKSLTLRVGDTWPMFIWPVGFAVAAINIAAFREEGRSAWLLRSTLFWARAGVVTGLSLIVVIFLYYVVSPWNLTGKNDPIGGESGFAPLASRVQTQIDATGAVWVAATDYRTYAMLRWYLDGRVPVVQLNERARFIGFRIPDVRDRLGILVLREPDNGSMLSDTPAKTTPLETVKRTWRGVIMDTYALKTIKDFAPDLSPPPSSPLYRWPSLVRDETEPRFNVTLLSD